MKSETQLLIELIKQNKSLNEISAITGLSNKQIFKRLSMIKNSGYIFDRSYYLNGDIRYSLHNPFINNKDKIIYVKTPKDIDKIRVILTSDTHLGHIQDSLVCIDSMIEYCINNNIHIVFNLGDLFEGLYPNRQKYAKFTTAEEQISYALKNYPYDKNILNFTLLGNHDSTFYTENGIDIKSIIQERRHDIIPVDYGYGSVNIGGVEFRLIHPLQDECEKRISNKDMNDSIILKGHSHKYKVNYDNRKLIINVPSLSEIKFGNQKPLPSMIDMELTLNNPTVSVEYLQQFIFINNKPIRVNEINYHIPIKIINPHYEEEIVKQTTDETKANKEVNFYKNDQYKGMSQIEKFESRYGNQLVKK